MKDQIKGCILGAVDWIMWEIERSRFGRWLEKEWTAANKKHIRYTLIAFLLGVLLLILSSCTAIVCTPVAIVHPSSTSQCINDMWELDGKVWDIAKDNWNDETKGSKKWENQ